MLFSKEHLKANDYNWTMQMKRDVFSAPDRRAFDPVNGNQVIYLINSFGESVGKLTIDEGQRLEMLIREGLPKELKSELAVFNWLKAKYLYYWNSAV